MSRRSTRLALLALCALPALGFDVRTHDGLIASFTYACPEFHVPPRVRMKKYTAEHLAPRTASWKIWTYETGMQPSRTYKVVGEVEVLQRGSRTTEWDLRQRAKAAAEKMGGDALVDVVVRDAGRTKPRVGEKGFLVFTAKVARMDEGIPGPIVGQ